MRRGAGFTLVEVLVALMIVAIGLAALMVAVSGTARTSGYLRDRIVAEWIALNRITEVRMNTNKFAQNTDTGEVYMANRMWHYDTRYFDTRVNSMKRIVVRVYAGDAKTKGNPIGEATGFLSAALGTPGSSNAAIWNFGMTPETAGGGGSGGQVGGASTSGANVDPNKTLTSQPPAEPQTPAEPPAEPPSNP